MKIVYKVLPLIVLAILFLIILKPLFVSGFFSVHDDTQPTRIFEMTQSLKDGLFPVRWVKDLGFGYGYPIFNFYAPLPYYVGALYHVVGFDAVIAAKMMYGTAVLVAGIGMYLLVRSFLGVLPALGAATVYLFFPYFAANIFIRGAVGEYFAYAFLPYIFWGLFKLYYSLKESFDYAKRWIILTSVSIALLILSHNLSAYMLGLTLVIFIIAACIATQYRKVLFIRLGIVFLFAFLLSAFYTLPVLFEMKFTDVQSQIDGQSQYYHHYVCPIQFWDSPWGYAGSAEGCVDGMSFRLGKSNIIFATLALFAGLYIFYRNRKRKHIFFFSVITCMTLFALFMTMSVSEFLWKILPQSQFLQFPWRFLNSIGFGIAVLVGFGIYFLKKFPLPTVLSATVFVIGATLFFNAKLFVPQNFNERNASYYTDKKNITFAISNLTNEYMPVGFQRPKTIQDVPQQLLIVKDNNEKVSLSQETTSTVLAQVTMKKDGIVLINKAYFPAWQLIVDNNPVTLEKTPTGMQIPLSEGTYALSLTFVQTPIEKIANTLSLTGVMALILGIIGVKKKKRHAKKTT